MTLATVTLQPEQGFMVQRKENGETVLIFPLDALKQSYCDYVAAEVQRGARQRGEQVQ